LQRNSKDCQMGEDPTRLLCARSRNGNPAVSGQDAKAPLGRTERGFFICCYRYSTLHLLHEPAQTLLEPLQLLPVAVRLRVCHQLGSSLRSACFLPQRSQTPQGAFSFKAMYLLDAIVLLRHCNRIISRSYATFLSSQTLSGACHASIIRL